MLSKIRSKLTYANIVATFALFVALSTGTAYAANTVFSTDIVDGEVTTQDLKGGAVTAGKLAPNSVTSGKIGEGQVRESDLGEDSVDRAEIVASAVGRDEIASGVVGGRHLDIVHEHFGAATNITDGTAHNGHYTSSSQTVSCLAGEVMLSVSVEWTDTGGQEERGLVGVSIEREQPQTATVEVNYDGGASVATYRPVATCIR